MMLSMDPTSIRIRARRQAEEAWTIVQEESDVESDQFVRAYWERIAELAAEIKPMSEVERMAFERRVMPFGAYAGKFVVEVPLQYLCNLCDPSSFIEEVKRYLKNPTVRRMMED